MAPCLSKGGEREGERCVMGYWFPPEVDRGYTKTVAPCRPIASHGNNLSPQPPRHPAQHKVGCVYASPGIFTPILFLTASNVLSIFRRAPRAVTPLSSSAFSSIITISLHAIPSKLGVYLCNLRLRRHAGISLRSAGSTSSSLSLLPPSPRPLFDVGLLPGPPRPPRLVLRTPPRPFMPMPMPWFTHAPPWPNWPAAICAASNWA